MRRAFITLLLLYSIGLPFQVCATGQNVTARLLVSNPTPFVGEEIDLKLEVIYAGHPGDQTRFSWPSLDNFIAADLTETRSQSGRDGKNRVIETISRRIKPLSSGTYHLKNALLWTGKQKIELLPITLRVQPLPVSGRLENFNNFVGTYHLTLSATGSGPREISLHIFDSNQLAPVPDIPPVLGRRDQLVLMDSTTRTAGSGGREHIQRYFYTPSAPEEGRPHFSLPIFDPHQKAYREVSTGSPDRRSRIALLIIGFCVFIFSATGLVIIMRRRQPQTVAECLERFCRRPITGLSREKILARLHPYFSCDEREALIRFWHHEDLAFFDQDRSPDAANSFPDKKGLCRSLWKAIDKQQHIT